MPQADLWEKAAPESGYPAISFLLHPEDVLTSEACFLKTLVLESQDQQTVTLGTSLYALRHEFDQIQSN